MKKTLICIALATIMVPSLFAADFSLGFRFNHFQLGASGDFWTDYVAGKQYDQWQYNRQDGEYGWYQDNPLIASKAQAEDFSNFNPVPAIHGAMRTDTWEFVLFDLELFDAKDIKIFETNLEPWKKSSPIVYTYDEYADFSLITLKHTANYIIPFEDSNFYVGGGIGWYLWEFNSEFKYVEYEIDGLDYYPNENSSTVTLEDNGLAIGIHLNAGYEYAMNDTAHPFFNLSYEYAAAKWEPDGLSEVSALLNSPNDAPFEGSGHPTANDKYWKFRGEIQDSYDIALSGLKVNFGLKFYL